MPANRIQLQNALHKPYDRVLFSREVLSPVFGSGFTLNSSLVPAAVSPNQSESATIDKVWIYGNIQLDDGTEITCYEVLLQPKVRIEQSKVAIQQYVRKLLTAGQAALINFVAPANKNVWRLTLVAKDSVLTDKGIKEKTTNAKRYTFLLGPSETCKTAAERFEVLSTEKEITFQTLVNAFSVEKLSNAFFEEYTLHYQKFCDYLQESNYRQSVFNISFPANATKQEKDKASKPIRDFVKKLLGRIVFLYFVQKKGWLGASDTNYTDGMGNFIKKLFHQSGGNESFYSNWLSVLFFDTLNKERTNDDFKMPDGKTLKVPFLNGGLFDKEEFDEHLLTFPAKLFHNPDFEDTILTKNNADSARGFLDFLDAFNFTVYEDSPDDHTVAVDPEMLGHIFENLLEDNKDKGAFYTPKEIVHYMCQESLTEYVKNSHPPEGLGVVRNSQNYFNLPYNPNLKEKARELRKAGNLPEVLFWNKVKNKQFKGFDFDRQKIVGNYIVDFFCTNCNVVIEIDGSSHDDKVEYDAERDTFLQSLGLTVIHIPANEVMNNLDGLMQMLFDHPALKGTPPKEGIWGEKVELLIKQKVVHELCQEELLHIDTLLDKVKICDPAIGSGAFPMGLLQEIFSIKELIAYETGKEWKPAETKLNIIQNSIYGVDIEKGAVDIARLRFWLSLVVDEEKPKPLPNLDYKIVVGDSLISKFDGEIVEIDWERKSSVGKADEYVKNVQRLLVDVANKQKQYFSPNNKNKKKLQTEIRNLKIELLINQLSFNKELYINKTVQKGGFMPTSADIKHNTERELQIAGFDKLISKLKYLLQHPDEPFNHFDWKLDFPEVLNHYLVNGNGGFDIVIGNPPFIQLQKAFNQKIKYADLYKEQNYETFDRTGDIYCLFYEKGINLLKPNGLLCYITSNKWMRAGYGEKLRHYFTKYNPIILIDLGPNVFENATVDTNILLIAKQENKNNLLAVTVTEKSKDSIDFTAIVKERAVKLGKLTKDAWFIGSDAEQRLKEKIERIGKPLKEWDVNIYYGIKTGLNEAFIITTEKRDEILANCKTEEERQRTVAIINPILRGRDIKRYYYEWAGLWVIGTFPALRLNIEDYPAIKKYFLDHFDIRQLEQSGKKYPELGFNARKKTSNEWFETQDQIAYYPEFEKEKVVYSEIVRQPQFHYDREKYFVEATSFLMTGKNVKYICGLLNSIPVTYFFKQYYAGGGLGKEGYRYKKAFLENLPIPPITPTNQPIVSQIEALVDKILAAKQQNPQTDTSHWEREIDRLVYELYGLTEEEIKIIEK